MPLLKSLNNLFSFKKCGCTKKLGNKKYKKRQYKGGYISGTNKRSSRSSRSNRSTRSTRSTRSNKSNKSNKK